MATRKQLAALKKARAARKKNLAAKKRTRKTPAKKRTKKTARKKAVRKAAPKKRSRKAPRKKRAVSSGTFIYARKGLKGKRFYLQKEKGEWNFNTKKPKGLRGKEITNAKTAAKKLVKKLPPGFDLFISGKKKR